MDKKKLTSLINRVKRAKSSFSVMGDMLLCYEFDTMSLEHLTMLQVQLVTKRIEYKPLIQAIVKRGML